MIRLLFSSALTALCGFAIGAGALIAAGTATAARELAVDCIPRRPAPR